MTNIIDQKQRDIIKNELNKNIFVEAGAGSGKTRSLVERMVSMVKSGIDVSNICAITFTKAAATEFYNRFENMLSEAINSDISDKEKILCEKALLNIDLCFMGTIDAFCNMILSENPVDAGIPLNSTIVQEEEYKFLINDEYNSILKEIQENGSKEEKDILENYLRVQTNPKETFTACMSILLDRRNYSIDAKDLKDIKEKEKKFYKKYQDEIQKLVKGIVDDDGIYMYVTSDINPNKAAKDYMLNNLWVIMDDWSIRPSAVMGYLNQGLKKVCIVKDFNKMSTAFNDYFKLGRNYYSIIKEKIEEIQKDYRSIQYDYTIAFVKRFVDVVANNLIKKGKLSFFDNLYLFRNLLRKDAASGGELINHITKRHTYYLVDEFQDTNPLQSEIIFNLTAEKPNEDFSLCKPKPGRLFIVGDPKQSIYRFRNADVLSYNFVKELFVKNGDEVIELTTNFRSHKEIINYFNAQFKSTFNNLYDGKQASFSSVEYADNDKGSPILEGIYKYSSESKKDSINVANLVANLHKLGYLYKDIMVLTRSKEKLRDYLLAFDEKNIPYEIEGVSVIDECKSFKNLRYLLGAIANPENSYYVYKALKIVFKLSDSHIYSVFNDNGPTLLKIVNDPKIDKLINFYLNNKDENIMVVINRLIDEFNLLTISSTKYLEYLFFAKELLREKVASGSIVTLKEAYNYFNDLVEKKIIEKGLSLSNDDKEDKVLLANVHKVKGLESKVVILTCNNSRSFVAADKVNIHSSFNEKKNYLIKVTKKSDDFRKYNYIETDDYVKEVESEAQSLLCEQDRIAYVAATRACDVLFVASNSFNDKNEAIVPWGDLISDDAVQRLIHEDSNLLNDYKPDDPLSLNSINLITKTKEIDPIIINNTYKIKSPSKLVNVLEEKRDLISKTTKDDSTLKGTIIHRLLELYVSNKYNDSIDNNLTIINNEYLLESKYDELLKNVFKTMKNGGYNQESGKINDLISELKKAEEVYTEVPFAYKEGNDIYNGIIDLLYKKDNKWFIVDYKTNYDTNELDKKYENQLEGYKKALSKQNIEANAFIYHINIK